MFAHVLLSPPQTLQMSTIRVLSLGYMLLDDILAMWDILSQQSDKR